LDVFVDLGVVGEAETSFAAGHRTSLSGEDAVSKLRELRLKFDLRHPALVEGSVLTLS